MGKKFYWTRVLPVIAILVNFGLSVAVVLLMQHVQNLLNSDVRINLTEIVTQNKDAITSRLLMNVSSLDIIANKIVEQFKSDEDISELELQKQLADYCQANNTETVFVATHDGSVFFEDGRRLDISARNYFRLAISGIENISDRVISRINGEEVFIISVPLHLGGKVVGTIQKVYSQKEFNQLCALSLFSANGYMHIINSEGYVILHTQHRGCILKTDNYFRDLYANGNPQAAEQIERDIRANRSGFMETVVDGRETFSAYTAIDKIHDWFLITNVPNDAVSPNGTAVIKLFYVILFVVVLIFTSSLAYFTWYKYRQRVQLEKIAFVDPVTGGNTYNKFCVDVQRIFAEAPGKAFSLVKFDIDNFKYINNFYGFEVGDRVLSSITRKISSQLRMHESMARITGDNFVLLLENADEVRLTGLLSSLADGEAILYFSAGVYAVNDTTESLSFMVDKAATAGQTVKGMLNKQIEYYSGEFETQNRLNEQMKRAVRLAIENREFLAFYQPKINVHDNTLAGAEALVRWKTPEGKFIFPNEFITLCEQTGLIVEIDMLVYEQVLQMLRSFLDEGVNCVPVSVNFSRQHLMDADGVEKIIALQQQYNVPANLIEIELTESAIYDNVDSIHTFARTMHSHGFALAMDDFGSGYSSLNMLKNVPIDILKFDKEFLTDSGDNARRNIIFSSLAQMAVQLNIRVVVEGVERLEDVDLMKASGCTIAQGYYYARPMEVARFATVFRAGSL